MFLSNTCFLFGKETQPAAVWPCLVPFTVELRCVYRSRLLLPRCRLFLSLSYCSILSCFKIWSFCWYHLFLKTQQWSKPTCTTKSQDLEENNGGVLQVHGNGGFSRKFRTDLQRYEQFRESSSSIIGARTRTSSADVTDVWSDEISDCLSPSLPSTLICLYFLPKGIYIFDLSNIQSLLSDMVLGFEQHPQFIIFSLFYVITSQKVFLFLNPCWRSVFFFFCCPKEK